MPTAARNKCVAEMRKFYYSCSSMEKSGDNRANGTRRVDNMEVGYLLKSLQQLVMASQLYGVCGKPDFGRELPERRRLLAFDLQPTNEPLDLARVNDVSYLAAKMQCNT
jgi:hypothetical protein